MYHGYGKHIIYEPDSYLHNRSCNYSGAHFWSRANFQLASQIRAQEKYYLGYRAGYPHWYWYRFYNSIIYHSKILRYKSQWLDYRVWVWRTRRRNAFKRRLCGYILGPINIPAEAMYWTTKADGSGQAKRSARLRPTLPGWRTSAQQCILVAHNGRRENHFVPNPINRYNVSDRSGLRTECRRLNRYLYPKHRPGRPRIQLASRALGQFHTLAARVPARSNHFGWRLQSAADCQSIIISVYEVQTSHYIRFCHDNWVGAWDAFLFILFLATHLCDTTTTKKLFSIKDSAPVLSR